MFKFRGFGESADCRYSIFIVSAHAPLKYDKIYGYIYNYQRNCVVYFNTFKFQYSNGTFKELYYFIRRCFSIHIYS